MSRNALVLIRAGAGLIGLALLLSLWASPDRTASLPWFVLAMVGVVLVLAVAGPLRPALARKVRSEHLVWLFLTADFLTLLVTLFCSRWPSYKLSWLNTVYAALPSIRSLPWWWAQEGLQPNQTGGLLAVCTAFAATVAVAGPVKGRHRWPATVLTVAGFVTVFMTGSRAGLASLVAAVLLVLIVRTSRWLWAWGSGLLITALALLASGRLAGIVRFFLRDATLDTELLARLDIWSSALDGVQDHFFTGIGLGVFNQVIPIRYPYQTVGLTYSVSQAHDLFLDVALAIGVPGALGMLSVLAGAALLGIDISRQGRLDGVVSLGILMSLVAYLTFGITDSISLSIPTSFIVWLWACALTVLSAPRLDENAAVAESDADGRLRATFLHTLVCRAWKRGLSWPRAKDLN